jgi:hypothetical protein
MKGMQTGQLRQQAEGQYLLHLFRSYVLCLTTIKFFFLRLAEKNELNTSIQQVLQEKQEKAALFLQSNTPFAQ